MRSLMRGSLMLRSFVDDKVSGHEKRPLPIRAQRPPRFEQTTRVYSDQYPGPVMVQRVGCDSTCEPWKAHGRSAYKNSTMTSPTPSPDSADSPTALARDIADVSAVELITTVSVHLMSAAAVRCGLAEEGEDLQDLDEARTLINALAALVTGAAPDLGDTHARSLRDGLRSVQLAFREASVVPDAPGQGPGEKYTGAVS